MRPILELLKVCLEFYKQRHCHVPFLCINVSDMYMHGLISKNEETILKHFIMKHRPIRRGQIGYDKTIDLDEENFWFYYRKKDLTLLARPNYQSRINFLDKHIKRLESHGKLS